MIITFKIILQIFNKIRLICFNLLISILRRKMMLIIKIHRIMRLKILMRLLNLEIAFWIIQRLIKISLMNALRVHINLQSKIILISERRLLLTIKLLKLAKENNLDQNFLFRPIALKINIWTIRILIIRRQIHSMLEPHSIFKIQI